MASGDNPVARISADGLPSELVVLASTSDPVSLRSDLGSDKPGSSGLSQAEEGIRSLGEETIDEENDVEFCQSVEEGISMVSSLSQFGNHLDVPERNVNESDIVQWLREVLIEDDYGKVDCKILIALIQKEFGSKKRKTRAWLKRAFPKSYLRRSDRNRWFCGISFRADQGKLAISAKDKEWIDKAVQWIHTSMEMNPTGKERCSDVHHALTQYIGQASVHMAISAVKMVFPNIPRKTFARIAFYVGIKFKDASLGHSSVQSAASTLNALSTIKTEYGDSAANKLVVAWLQKALIADPNRRERIRVINSMIKKKFGKSIPEAKAARLVKRAHPNVDIRLKGSVDGLVWGVRIDNAFRPRNSWVQKTVAWLKEIIEPTDSSYCENAGPIFELMTERLGLEKPSKCMTILREAIPSVQLKEILGCQVVFGMKLKDNAAEVEFPDFSEEDLSQSQEMLEMDDGIALSESCDQPMYEENSIFPQTSTPTASGIVAAGTVTANQPIEIHNEHVVREKLASVESQFETLGSVIRSTSGAMRDDFLVFNSKISEMQKNMAKIANDISSVKVEVEKLVKDNMKSSQQKDSLIIQLQQTLIMLCQQQLQKFIPGEQNFSEQTLSTILQKGLLSQNDTSEV